jgi:hypothetical protein
LGGILKKEAFSVEFWDSFGRFQKPDNTDTVAFTDVPPAWQAGTFGGCFFNTQTPCDVDLQIFPTSHMCITTPREPHRYWVVSDFSIIPER